MKATLKGKVIAASDDIVEQGGYPIFPMNMCGSNCSRNAEDRVGPRVPAWRPVL
jgi:hypothetical protein